MFLFCCNVYKTNLKTQANKTKKRDMCFDYYTPERLKELLLESNASPMAIKKHEKKRNQQNKDWHKNISKLGSVLYDVMTCCISIADLLTGFIINFNTLILLLFFFC